MKIIVIKTLYLFISKVNNNENLLQNDEINEEDELSNDNKPIGIIQMSIHSAHAISLLLSTTYIEEENKKNI